MEDQEMWDRAVDVVSREYAGLAEGVINAVKAAAALIKHEKDELNRLTSRADAAVLCADCGGACCRTGKHHFSVTDALVYLSSGRDLIVPAFGGNSCPYLADHGCLMEPSFRPFPCITFNCELIESRLSQAESDQVRRSEQLLRHHYRAMEALFGLPPLQGMLLAYEKSQRFAGQGILAVKNYR